LLGLGALEIDLAFDRIGALFGRREHQGRGPGVSGVEVGAAVGVEVERAAVEAHAHPLAFHDRVGAGFVRGLGGGALLADRELVAVEQPDERECAEIRARDALVHRGGQRHRSALAAGVATRDREPGQRGPAIPVPVGLPDRDGQFLPGLEPDFSERRLVGQPDRLAVVGRSAGKRVETRTDPLARDPKCRLLQILGQQHHAADQRQVQTQNCRAAGRPADRKIPIGQAQRFQRDLDGVRRWADCHGLAAGGRVNHHEDEGAEAGQPNATECCARAEHKMLTFPWRKPDLPGGISRISHFNSARTRSEQQ
jgi:hypothetical protein